MDLLANLKLAVITVIGLIFVSLEMNKKLNEMIYLLF